MNSRPLICLMLFFLFFIAGCSAAEFSEGGNGGTLRPDIGVGNQSCLPGERRCTTANSAQTCSANGQWEPEQTCTSGDCVRGRCPATCGDGCAVGESVCSGNAVQRCVDQGNGCGIWSTSEPCGEGLSCRSGQCECRSTCMRGQMICVGDAAVRTCTESGCWSPIQACRADEVCSAGMCQPSDTPCQDACQPGQLLCVNETQYQLCERQANGCYDYSNNQACADGEICMNTSGCQSAACPNQPCSIGDSRCIGNAIQICEPDAFGCAIWGTRVGCGTGEACVNGQCEAQCTDECTVGQSRCGDANSIEICQLIDGCAQWIIEQTCPGSQSCLSGGTCGECSSGDTEVRDCGNCGEQTRICQNGAWSNWSPCANEGPCVQGSQKSCGNCGVQICNTQCEWNPCTGQGECAAGELADCGECGQRRCSDQCTWSEPCNNGSGTLYRDCAACGWQFCCPEGDWCPCSGHYPSRCDTNYCADDGRCVECRTSADCNGLTCINNYCYL